MAEPRRPDDVPALQDLAPFQVRFLTSNLTIPNNRDFRGRERMLA